MSYSDNIFILLIKINCDVFIDKKKKHIDETFNFSGEDVYASGTVAFAQGYAQCLMWMKSLNYPLSQQTDGWYWCDRDNNKVIIVTDQDDNII